MSENSAAAAGGKDLFGDPWVEPKDPRGRKRHERTEQIAESIKQSVADGMKVPEIALRTGLSEPTLRKYYFRELDHGTKMLRAELVALTMNKAREGNVSALKLALQLIERGEAEGFDKPARPARSPRLGKKEEADLAAETAGQGSDWGDDLRVH